MRHLTEFSPKEWLQLLPMQHAMKQLRNDAWLAYYKQRRPADLPRFLEQTRRLAGKTMVAVIAFEQPWALNWLLRMANRNLADGTVVVFDNSRNDSKRVEIEQVCKSRGTPYLALPENSTTHVNRSHGMAMNWVYHNAVKAIGPRNFGFIDHDLIPVRPVSIDDKLKDQPIYGLVNTGRFGFWSLWAGYCFFDYATTKDRPVNFLYDFSRDLDTGGRNWDALYRDIDRNTLRIATSVLESRKVPGISGPRDVQFIDRGWLHLGGISYNDTLRDRLAFFEGLEKCFDTAERE
jgi:hypothetical protein